MASLEFFAGPTRAWIVATDLAGGDPRTLSSGRRSRTLRPPSCAVGAIGGTGWRILAAGEGGLNAEEMTRLEEIKVDLDRSYDLLHQRQARIAAGLNPDEAEIRPADMVEGYEQ